MQYFFFGGVSILSANKSADKIVVFAEEKTTDTEFADTYLALTDLINSPTVISRLESVDSLEKIMADTARPSNLILYLDKNCNVVDTNGQIIDTLSNVYAKLNHKIIPIVYISSKEETDAFNAFLLSNDVLDIAVMSNNSELIKNVRETHLTVRGIIDFSGSENIKNTYDIVKTANINYATIVVLPQSATQKDIEFIQARFKTVWVNVDGTKDIDLYDGINSGAYGIIVREYNKAYSLLKKYPTGYIRPSFNVAHRGVMYECNENSVSGVKKAIEYGATYVELDGRLTKDGVIMMMHDANISRVTDGTGNIESMTYEETKTYKLNTFNEEPIATLGDIMTELKGTGVVLVFEVKTTGTEIIKVLRETIEQYDFFDQIVIITFYESQLKDIKKEIPEVSTGLLANGITETNFKTVYLKKIMEYNCILDCNAIDENFNQFCLRDRGFIGWYWTFDSDSAIDNAMSNGYVGITNNYPGFYATETKHITKVDVQSIKEGQTFSVGDKITLTLEMYTDKTEEVEGEIYCLEEYDNYYAVIARYKQKEGYAYPMYTKIIKIYKETENDSSCRCGIDSIVTSVCLCFLCIFCIVKYRNKCEKK